MNAPYHSNPWIGRLLGDNQRYRLDRRLGGGGMGDVFLATDTRIGQQVALKLLKDNLVESPEMRQRFEHEIAICAALSNEHIVNIMDSGITPEGYPFYVMEYLRGFTLGELLREEHQLSIDRTAKIISQICNGLLLAHQGVDLPDGEHIEAVIHRDLKPDNIFLQPTDLGEWVKIVDFGIAKIRYKDRQNQTLTHTFLGTLRYASPEQMMGDRELDARSDIYSLGVILYEMLSGADPFGFNIKPRPMSEASWIIAHTSEQPISLRSQPNCGNLPASLEAVTRKCLEKTPDLRFTSVAEFNQALQAAIASSGVNITAEGSTIVQPRPVAPQPEVETMANVILTVIEETMANVMANVILTPTEETIAKVIPTPIEETIAQPIAATPNLPLEETIAQPIAATPNLPQPIASTPNLPLEETIAQPIKSSPNVTPTPIPVTSIVSPPPVEGSTQVQPRPIELGKHQPIQSVSTAQTGLTPDLETQVQTRLPVAGADSNAKSSRPIPWLPIAIGGLAGLASILGIYLFTHPKPTPIVPDVVVETPIESSPTVTAPITNSNNTATTNLAAVMKLVDGGKLKEAIASAKQISQNNPDYAQAQIVSTDAARLVEAIATADRGELKAAIDLAKKISSTSPIYKKAQAFIKDWSEI
ncbi:protein kinase domain-containing protein [Chamaesiphon sp. VAR_48_metabat_403]|uniref:serine/threonine protein kinase n=1 Tax=Chamaesiphon sp. VAR_48_metabat_403 TaxID=2964700 RepID=UPI00286DCC81|nr:protein kinase [Chamaesiphon sp. VAR_48_metabat_403]